MSTARYSRAAAMLAGVRPGDDDAVEATRATLTELLDGDARVRSAVRAVAVADRRRDWAEPASDAARAVDAVLGVDADSGDGLRLVPASEVRPEAVEWLWRPRIARGTITLLVGIPGLGKSMLAGELCARASRGELPGDLPGPATVLYATAEDSPAHTLVPRLMAAGADLDRVQFVRLVRDGIDEGITLPDDMAALTLAVERSGAAMLVVDPLMAHLSGGIDSHRDHSIRRALAPLYRTAEDTGAAMLVVGHLNKAPSGDLFQRVGGSIGLTGSARTVLLMTHDPEAEEDPDARVLTHGKSNLGPLAPALRLRVVSRRVAHEGRTLDTAVVELLDEAPHLRVSDVLAPASDEDRSERDEARDYLRTVLEDGPRPSRDVIREARDIGISERTLRRAKSDLGVTAERQGYGSDGRWCWRLPPIDGHPCRQPMDARQVADYENSALQRDGPGTGAPIDGHTQSLAGYGPDEPPDDLFDEAEGAS